MEEEKAWNLFIKTGKLEDYLEYKNLCNDRYEEDNIETYKNNWNCNKGNRF